MPPREEILYKKISNLISTGVLPNLKGLRAVDIGSGTGIGLETLLRLGADAVGVENCPGEVEDFRRDYPEHAQRMIHCDLRDIKTFVEPESVDLVTSFMSPVNWPEFREGMSQIPCMLRSGGYVIFTLFYGDDCYGPVEDLELRHGLIRCHRDYFWHCNDWDIYVSRKP